MEVIRVENLSKLYDLGQVGTGTISKDLNRWWANVRGKNDPYSRIGQVNDRTKKAEKDETVWALKEINFSVNQGEIVGVIGRNGAGKSTLLKIISRITTPTSGSVKIKGRIASLLEVGTGFHPEMTGRENIFMNGTLLGMTRREIQTKLDEIIDFAGVALYIDTPVKRYSSGMQVRLAFAVAAFLEPEILIVDEVLAVGDAEFQKKAIGRMQEVSRGDGRTVLFVSHNMIAVKSLCKSGILLNKGSVEKVGEIEDVIFSYLTPAKSSINSFIDINLDNDGFNIKSLKISNNGIDGHFSIDKDLIFEISVSSLKDFESININIFFKVNDAVVFATCSNADKFEKGQCIYHCIIPSNTLNDIIYTIDVMVVSKRTYVLHNLKDIASIEGVEEKREGSWMGKFPGFIRPGYYKWTKNKIKV
jgi:lipopolysaccharide transport system ATP-binding protein